MRMSRICRKSPNAALTGDIRSRENRNSKKMKQNEKAYSYDSAFQRKIRDYLLVFLTGPGGHTVRYI